MIGDNNNSGDPQDKVVVFLGAALFLAILFSVIILVIVQLHTKKPEAATIKNEADTENVLITETANPTAPANKSLLSDEMAAIEQKLTELELLDKLLQDPKISFD